MDPQTFWDSDFDYIQMYFDNYSQNMKDKEKETLITNYNLATMISSFVNMGLNGKKPPSIGTMYPELFSELDRKNKINQFQVAMMNFANQWNSKRNGGQ